MTTTRQSDPFVVDPGQGEAIWHLDTSFTFLADSERTGGRLAAWEQLLPHRSSPPLHVHSDADEAWLVLDGALTFQVSGEEFRAGPGAFVWAPRGLPHTFRVDSPTARLLGLALPAGFDRFVVATGRPADAASLPPAPDGEPDIGALVAAAREHGMEVLGPPLG